MILCWLNELFGTKGSGPLSATLRKHTESCAACRHSARNTTALENLLMKDSQTFAARPSPFLQRRIIDSVQNPGSVPKAALTLQTLLFRLAGPVSACALLALVLFGLSQKNNVNSRQPDPVKLTMLPPVQLPIIPSIKIKVEDPLTIEMQSLVADSMNAARSLAANFLPANLEP